MLRHEADCGQHGHAPVLELSLAQAAEPGPVAARARAVGLSEAKCASISIDADGPQETPQRTPGSAPTGRQAERVKKANALHHTDLLLWLEGALAERTASAKNSRRSLPHIRHVPMAPPPRQHPHAQRGSQSRWNGGSRSPQRCVSGSQGSMSRTAAERGRRLQRGTSERRRARQHRQRRARPLHRGARVARGACALLGRTSC
mmetsp:Transcript_145146/g.463730  ORF Transcript_145146/g.463730 Transcript_145146/m.463730 type:complete len:203 (-) Transcript_145146:9-617(-)